MLRSYLLVLGARALFTAYTRNFQRTLVELESRLDEPAASRLMPRVSASGPWRFSRAGRRRSASA
jgi:hypothetical protein